MALAAVAVVAAVLAACGASNANRGPGAVDPNGVLKYGYPMPVAGLHLDPALSTVAADTFWMSLVYGTLMKQRADGVIEPGMAKSAEVLDPTSVRITLREGVKFSDGSAFDAEAVRTSLLRAHTPGSPAAVAALDPGMKALADVQVVDPLTAVARLSAPVAGQFMIEMTQRDGAIVSPKQIAENPKAVDATPIGAGPFVVVGNVAQQKLSFRKSPTYWDATNVQLGGVDIINTPSGPQQANGLLSGQLDWAAYVPVDSAAAVDGEGGFATATTTINNVELLMCTGKAPFDNPAVRQALQLGVDRQRFADIAFAGKTVPAYSFFREDNKNFAPAVRDLVKFDPDRAKQFLASAGPAAAAFDLHFPATLDFANEAAAMQAQLTEIGFKPKVIADRDSIAAFLTPQAPGALLTATIGFVGYRSFFLHFAQGGQFAICGGARPEIMAAADQAAALDPNDPAAIAAYQRAQQMIAGQALVVPVVAYPTIAGWSTSRVGGTPVFDALGFPVLESLHIMG